jgi:O-antigen/teichoic acid export membrane protein
MSSRKIAGLSRKLGQHPFWIMLGGIGGAQLIGLAGAPLLTRSYTPEAFGALSLFTVALSVAAAAAGGRYEQAIFSETDDSNACNLVALATCCALLWAATAALVLPFFPLEYNIYSALLPALPTVVFYVLGIAISNWLVRKRSFRSVSSAKMKQAAIVLSIALLLAGTEYGLLLANVAGYAFWAIFLAFAALKTGWDAREVQLKKVSLLAKSNASFPLYGTLPAVLDGLATLFPIYWLANNLGQGSLGLFELNRQVIAVPLGMIAAAISVWLTKTMADAVQANASLTSELIRFMRLVFLPLIAVAIAVSLVGPQAFKFFFGEKWEQAGEVARWMVWAYVAATFISPLSATLIVLKKVALNGVWQAAHFSAILIVLGLFSFNNVVSFSRALVYIEIASYAVYAFIIFYAAAEHDKKSGVAKRI